MVRVLCSLLSPFGFSRRDLKRRAPARNQCAPLTFAESTGAEGDRKMIVRAIVLSAMIASPALALLPMPGPLSIGPEVPGAARESAPPRPVAATSTSLPATARTRLAHS